MMYVKKNILFLICALSALLVACDNEEYNGDKLINYPDIEQLINKEWNMDSQRQYLRVTQRGADKDSSLIAHNAMPWDAIKLFFKKANIHQEQFDQHYTIEMLSDSSTGNMTFYYKSVVPEDYTNAISIVTTGDESIINNMYIETREDGTNSSKRVLFIPDKLIQILDRTSEPPSADTYYFLE